MLYKIGEKYYMLRNREYIEVDIKLENNEFSVTPKREHIIENNDNVQAYGILINDLIETLKKKEDSNTKRKNKYDI